MLKSNDKTHEKKTSNKKDVADQKETEAPPETGPVRSMNEVRHIIGMYKEKKAKETAPKISTNFIKAKDIPLNNGTTSDLINIQNSMKKDYHDIKNLLQGVTMTLTLPREIENQTIRTQ